MILSWAMFTLIIHSSLCLTLNAPITTKVVCFSRLLKRLRSLYGKQCGPRSDCFYRSSLFWIHNVCFYTWFVSNARQLFAADDFSRRHFQMHFLLGALRVNIPSTAQSTYRLVFLRPSLNCWDNLIVSHYNGVLSSWRRFDAGWMPVGWTIPIHLKYSTLWFSKIILKKLRIP